MTPAIRPSLVAMSAWCFWTSAAAAQATSPAMQATPVVVHTPTTPAAPATPSNGETPERSPNYLLRLGDHLLTRDMHYRAIGVYEELAWSTDDDAMRRTARLRVALAYHAAGRYEDAIKGYDETLRLQLDGETQRLVLLQLFVAQFGHYVEQGADDAIGDIRSQLAPLMTAEDAVGELARYHAARMLLFESSDTELHLPVPAACTGRQDATCRGFRALHGAARTPRPASRSPWVAVALSAVVPGLGSVYSGHYVDGLYYFLLSGGSAALALNVVDTGAGWDNQKAAVYVLGTVAIATYVASLIGASLGAQRHNAIARYKYRRMVLERTPEILPLLDAVR